MTDYSVNIELNIEQANARIRELERRLDGMSSTAQQAGRTSSSSFEGAANSINAMEAKVRDLTEQLKRVEVGSDAFRELSQEVRQAASELGDAQRAARGIESVLEDVGNSAQGLGGKFSGLTEIARGAFQKIGEFGIELAGQTFQMIGDQVGQSIGKFAEYQQAMLVIEQQIKTTGSAAGVTAKDIQSLAESISSNTSASILDVTKASQILLSYTNVTGDLFEETMRLSQDFMTVLKPITGDELPDAVERLGEALQSPIAGLEGLEEAKIYFTESEKQVIKAMEESGQLAEAQRIILDKVKESMEGVAEASGQGVSGGIAEMNKAIENAQLLLGQALAPVITEVANLMADLITELLGGTDGASGMSTSAERLAIAIKAVDVKALAADIKTIVGAFVSFINVVGKATTAYINFQRNTPLGWLARGAGALAGEIYGRSTIDASVSEAQFTATRKLYQAQGNAFIRSRGGVAGTIGGGTSVEIPAFAAGGIVASPTMALIGEGGMNEAVVPLPDGRSIPVQFSGAGGSAGDSERVARLIGREVGVQVAQAMQPFYRQGDIGPTSTGAHFDIKRQDRSYFDRTALDQYVSINGNTPLSAGVTLQGGRFGAPRSYGSHNGWDFAFSGQADLTLKNGAQWVGNTPNTGHGDKASFMTPDGKVYEILHGTFHGQAKPVAAIGGGSGSAPSKAAEIAIALKESLGLTEAQAAGIVGNFLREAGADLNPRINEGGRVGLPLGRGGYGLAQWTGSRQEDLVRFAGSKEAAGNLETQLRFVVHELMGSERNALEKLKQAQSPEEAAAVFEKYYERAGVKAIGERQANARNVFNELQGIGGGEVNYAKTLNDAAREAERLAEARASALEKLQEEIETLKGGNQDLGDRLSLIQRETELYQAGMPIMDGTMELLARESEATRELEKYKASLAEQVAAEMITKEQSQDLEQQYQDALTQSIELTKQMTQAESDLNKARENYESLQRYNEAYKAQTQAMRDRLAEIRQSTSATEQQLYQGQLTGFGTRATDDALFAIQAYNEGQAYLAEQMAALNEEFDKGLMAPEAYQERLTQIKTASEELTEALLKQRDAQGILNESAQRSAEIQAQQKQIIDNATSGFASFTMSVLSGSESMAQATGKLFQSILSNLANQALNSFFGGLFGGIFGGGGGGGIKFFAKGGVVDKPTNAIMGEAGAEAIVPLPDGRSIPVIMRGGDGGGSTNITVNVSGSQGSEDGRRLGRQISEAIKAELANQRRTGGLLR